MIKKTILLAMAVALTFLISSSATAKGVYVYTLDGMDWRDTLTDSDWENDDTHYMFDSCKELMPARNTAIGTYQWDGNIFATPSILNNIVEDMTLAYENAKKWNMGFVVVSHSWGTVLATSALRKIYDQDISNGSSKPSVVVDHLMTLSSPIHANFMYNGSAADLVEATVESTTKKVINDAGLSTDWDSYSSGQGNLNPIKEWTNFWAYQDLISGPLESNTFGFGTSPHNVLIGPDDSLERSLGVYTTNYWHKLMTANRNSSVLLWDKTYLNELADYVQNVINEVNENSANNNFTKSWSTRDLEGTWIIPDIDYSFTFDKNGNLVKFSSRDWSPVISFSGKLSVSESGNISGEFSIKHGDPNGFWVEEKPFFKLSFLDENNVEGTWHAVYIVHTENGTTYIDGGTYPMTWEKQ